MNKDQLIRSINDNEKLQDWHKKELLLAVIASPDTNTELEKYKIDKMIEAGLVKETSVKQERWYQLAYTLLTDAKLRYVYIATLIFITMIFNSSRFWAYKFYIFR